MFYDAHHELKRLLAFLGLEVSDELIFAASASIRPQLRRSRPLDFEARCSALPRPVLDLYAAFCKEAGPVWEKVEADRSFNQADEIDSLDKALAKIRQLEAFLEDRTAELRDRELELAALSSDQNMHALRQLLYAKHEYIAHQEGRIINFEGEVERLQHELDLARPLAAEYVRKQQTWWWRALRRSKRITKAILGRG